MSKLNTLYALQKVLAALPPNGTLVPGERPDFVAHQRKALEALIAELKSK